MNRLNTMSDNDFIGMSKEDAFKLCEQHGLIHRVTMENGQAFIVTMDYRMNRVNFHIDNNVVVSQKRG